MDRNANRQHRPVWDSGQARKSLWIETSMQEPGVGWPAGQARKSLWIETVKVSGYCAVGIGQARKSLWIETLTIQTGFYTFVGSGS